MNIYLNGKICSIENSLTVAELIENKELSPAIVIVEINDKVIPRKNYKITKLQQDDRVEVLRLVGGG